MIPPEVTEIVLSHLSPKSLLKASTVCQVWYHLTMYPLYHSVDLYSTHQHQRFMDGLQANNDRVADEKMKTGFIVRKLSLHTSNILMDESEITILKHLCPLMTSFDYADISLTDEHLCFFTPGWKNLKRLPDWHEDESRKWIPELGGQLTEVGCYMEELAVLPSLITPSPLFPCLVDLRIKLHYIGPRLDITWMEMINDQCPVLESLHMEFMNFDFGDNNIVGDWKPAENLRVLAWAIDRYIDPIWYNYLAQKYPQLTELYLSFYGEDEYSLDSTGDPTLHKTSIYNMVKNYQHLTTFGITSSLGGMLSAEYYPWCELGTWLGTEEAKHIKCLRWEVGLCTPWISDDNDSNMNGTPDCRMTGDQRYPLGNIKQLDHLAIDICHPFPQQMSGLCFGTLDLQNMSILELAFDQTACHSLDINLILDVCPNITVLDLLNVNITDMDRTTKHQRQLRTRLSQFELSCGSFRADDYITRFVNRCPNLSILKLRHCKSYDRPENRFLHSFTINAPHHSFSLVNIHAIISGDGTPFRTLNVKQTSQAINDTVAYPLNMKTPPDEFVIDLLCSYVDTITFE